jgi:catechol 2,3-dioxygenase-like lactoylglutathione lyase family enzyme
MGSTIIKVSKAIIHIEIRFDQEAKLTQTPILLYKAAPMFPIQFNHISLHVSDLEKSHHFYGDILGFKEVPRPNFSYPGTWFSMGNGTFLHLIAGKDYKALSSNRGNHFAFAVKDAFEAQEILEGKGVEIVSNKVRADGIQQLFVKDPDGYYVEFSEEKIDWKD